VYRLDLDSIAEDQITGFLKKLSVRWLSCLPRWRLCLGAGSRSTPRRVSPLVAGGQSWRSWPE
jgi:hypothetical protein